jgi:hypothetical protein
MIRHPDLGGTRLCGSIVVNALFAKIQIRLISDIAPRARDSASAQ